MTRERTIGIELTVDDKGTPKLVRFGRVAQETFARSAREAQGLERGMGRVESRADSLTRRVFSLRTALAGLGLAYVAKGFLDMAANVELARAQLEGLGYSAQAAASRIAALLGRDYSKVFGFEAARKGVVRLESVRATIGDVDRAMRILADSVAAFGGGAEEIQLVTMAIQQMAGKGVVSLEELRQQLGERIPDAAQAMAAGLGMSMAEMSALIQKGALDAATGIAAMLDELERRHGGATQRLLDTWQGLIQQMEYWWARLQQEVMASGAFDELKAALQDILARIEQAAQDGSLQEWARSVGGALADLVQALRWLGEHLDLLVVAAGAAGAALAAFKVETLAAAGGAARLAAAFGLAANPFGLMVSALGAVVVGLAALQDHLGRPVERLQELTAQTGRLADQWSRSRDRLQAFRADMEEFDRRLAESLGNQEAESRLLDSLLSKYPQLRGEYESTGEAIETINQKRGVMLSQMEAEVAAKQAEMLAKAQELTRSAGEALEEFRFALLKTADPASWAAFSAGLERLAHFRSPLVDLQKVAREMISEFNKLAALEIKLPAGRERERIAILREQVGRLIQELGSLADRNETVRARLGDMYDILKRLGGALRGRAQDMHEFSAAIWDFTDRARKAGDSIATLVRRIEELGGVPNAEGYIEPTPKDKYAGLMVRVKEAAREYQRWKEEARRQADERRRAAERQAADIIKIHREVAQERQRLEQQALEAEKRWDQERLKAQQDLSARLLELTGTTEEKRRLEVERTLAHYREQLRRGYISETPFNRLREAEWAAYYRELAETQQSAVDRMLADWASFGDHIEQLTVDALKGIQAEFTHTFKGVLTGEIEDLGDAFESFADNVLNVFASLLAQIATLWASANIAGLIRGSGYVPLTSLLPGGGGFPFGLPSPQPTGNEGYWDIGGAASFGTKTGWGGYLLAGGLGFAGGSLLAPLLFTSGRGRSFASLGAGLGAMAGMSSTLMNAIGLGAMAGPWGALLGGAVGFLGGGLLGDLFGGDDDTAEREADARRFAELAAKLRSGEGGIEEYLEALRMGHRSDNRVGVKAMDALRAELMAQQRLPWWAPTGGQMGVATRRGWGEQEWARFHLYGGTEGGTGTLGLEGWFAGGGEAWGGTPWEQIREALAGLSDEAIDRLGESISRVKELAAGFDAELGELMSQFTTAQLASGEWVEVLRDQLSPATLIQKAADEARAQGLNELDIAQQKVAQSIDALLGGFNLSAEQTDQLIDLLMESTASYEELQAKMEEYRSIEEQLKKAHELSKEEIKRLVARGRQLREELGLGESAFARLQDGIGQMVEAINKDFLPAIKDLISALRAGAGAGDRHHHGGLIMHAGGLADWALSVGLISWHGGARRLHGGGGAFWPRLARDEVPAILQRGEFVVRAASVDAQTLPILEAINRLGAAAVKPPQRPSIAAPPAAVVPAPPQVHVSVHVEVHGDVLGDGAAMERIQASAQEGATQAVMEALAGRAAAGEAWGPERSMEVSI